MDDFEQFWTIYPRRVAKAHARKMWNRLTVEEQFAALHALPLHVRYWKLSGRPADRIPHAGTWLNPDEGRRWEDELEMPSEKNDPSWYKTTIGIERKAREVGLSPRPGEDWHTLKARVLAKMKEAA